MRLRRYNLKLKARKCAFARPKVTYLGHTLTRDGVRPANENTEYARNF